MSAAPPPPPPPPPFRTPSLAAVLAQADPRILYGFVLFHWRQNPLVARLWRKFRPYALGLFLFQFILGSAGILATAFSGGKGVAAAIGIGFAALVGLLALGIFAAQIAAPILYADWAYGYTWLKDETLRLSRLTRTERMMGIMLPALATVGCFFLPAFVITPITLLLQHLSMPPNMQFMTGVDLPSRLLFAVAGISQHLLYTALYLMLFATVLVRRLIQRPAPDVKTDKGWGYLLVPFLLVVCWYLLWSIIRGCLIMIVPMFIMIPAITSMSAAGAKPPPGGLPAFDIPWWAGPVSGGLSIAALLIDLLALYLLYLAFRSFWKDDLVLARERLFDVTGQPAPPSAPATAYPAPTP